MRTYTAPSSQVLKDTKIFTEEDFNVRKLIRSVIKQGDPQASDFATALKDDDDEITRLINYLNRFTREVVQRCADISSESTKSMFVQLRKELKKQGKNLTLFIEDFTGFTGIDSELITVLSTEHGGDYADLCRVTAIIGITNDYYDQFRDNFTDRVTHQISVTENSYGREEFLIQMAGRYLNAIYCDPEQLREWNNNGAEPADLPTSDFMPPCDWDSITINGKEVSLYPFNRKSLLRLYECLPAKSPRMFLKEVIRAQLKEYLDGKLYGDGWVFPLNPGNTQMAKDTHGSAIDRKESVSNDDKTRLKAVFALWGDGSAAGIKKSDGTILIGNLNKSFLEDIDLGFFNGIGDVRDDNTGKLVSEPKDIEQSPAEVQPATNVSPTKKPIDGATQNYNKFKNDITGWYTKNEPLKFDYDYRSWLRTFICGSANQNGAINWQDCGIPAYVAEQRLASDLSNFYIEAQSTPINESRAIVIMERNAESRDALLALNELDYAKGWGFEGSVYYQQRLITWLERHKEQIIEKVIGVNKYEAPLPVLEWCLATQYLKACILGRKVDTSTTYTLINSLFTNFEKDTNVVRESKEWTDLVRFIDGRTSEFDSTLNFLKCASATTMGAIHSSANSKTRSCYRTDELVSAVEDLIDSNWDIEKSLPEVIPSNHLLYNPAALLKALYSKIKVVVDAESKNVSTVIEKLTEYVGELNQQNLVNTLSAIQDIHTVFAANSIMGSNELRVKYEKAPLELATEIMKHLQSLSSVKKATPVQQLTVYSNNSLHELFEFLRDLRSISQKAEKEEFKAKKELQNMGAFEGIDQLSDSAMMTMRALYDEVEAMEVKINAAE